MYYFVFILGVFFSIQKEKKLTFNFYLIILMFLSFFRFGVGSDYFSYYYLYDLLYSEPLNELLYGTGNQEILFRLIGSILKGLGFSYQWYITLFATINLLFIAKTCVRYSEKPTMSLFLYYSFFYFVWTFSGIRQGVVLAVGGYYYLKTIEDNKSVKFLFIVILLSFIHTSILIMVPIYLLNRLNWTQKRFSVVSTISVILSFLPLNGLLTLLSQIPVFNPAIFYISADYSVLQGFDIQSFARIIFLVIGIVYYDMFTKENPKNKTIMNSFLVSLNIYFIFKSSEDIAARLSIYGFYLIIIILPSIYYIYKDRLNKFIFQFFLIVLCVFYFGKELTAMRLQTGLIPHNYNHIPYSHVFNINQGYYFDNRYIEYID